MNRFVILAAPRTGSNLLCTLLNSHPSVVCHHELFNPRGIFYALDRRDGPTELGALAERDRDPIGFLDRLWQRERASAAGFKWTRGQNERALRHVARDADVLKIILRRRNRVKTFVSERIAEALDEWEVYERDALTQERPRIRVRAMDLLDHADSNARFYAELDALLDSQPRLELDYEELSSPRVHERALRFLGVSDPRAPLRARSVKQNPDDLSAIVENLEELGAALRGTDLESELTGRDEPRTL